MLLNRKMENTQEKIGLSLGDPTGIGPELWVKTLSQTQPDLLGRFVLFGDALVLDRTAHSLSLQTQWRAAENHFRLEPVTQLGESECVAGRPSLQTGRAQVLYLEAALMAACRGDIAGLCTGPIHKDTAMAAGLGFAGHTEFLASRVGRPNTRVVMMLAGPKLRVALCTTHVPLKDVSKLLTEEVIFQTLRTTVLSLREDFGLLQPTIYVVGLNPHAGENGHFGDEEQRLLKPALLHARQVLPAAFVGPLVPDVAFRQAVFPIANQATPAAILAMYHDQGLIPLKLLHFDDAVNVTLGLSIVRTSPDHGVAHDIAGLSIARPFSLQAALALCLSHVDNRALARCRSDAAVEPDKRSQGGAAGP